MTVTRQHVALLALAAAVATPASARADAPGSLGLSDKYAIELLVGQHTADAQLLEEDAAMGTPPTPAEFSGNMGMLRFKYGGYFRASRFGSLMGVEFTTSFGFFSQPAVARDIQDGEGTNVDLDNMTWGKFFHDMELGLNADFLHRYVLGKLTRFMLVGGIGYNTDMSYLYAGGRFGYQLSDSLEVAGTAEFRRGGSAAEGHKHRKYRLGGTIVLPNSKLGVGAELWVGDNRRDDDTTTITRALRGEYTSMFVTVSFRGK